MKNYLERFNDIAILQLDIEGFNDLTDTQKQLAYHLSEAGLWGRYISVDQGSIHNNPLIKSLIQLYKEIDKNHPIYSSIYDTLFIIFAHNGIYHSMSGEKLDLPLSKAALESHDDLNQKIVNQIVSIWFSSHIPQFRTVQTDGVDVVSVSGGNFYKNLTTHEVEEYRKTAYPKVENDEVPPFGFNERLVKDDSGAIQSEIVYAQGLYGKYIQKIISELTQALKYTENEQQHESIETLIKFYETGDPFDFDIHSVAWAKDQDSSIYFINGLIESYEDPLGIGCTFESIVAFKNPISTAKVNKIIENIQWFEDNLPIDKEFKKDKAAGLSASSIKVISMAGDTSPSLPLGINLPNSDWIRKKHGSKSVNLENSASSRSAVNLPLQNALFLEKYHSVLTQYKELTNSLHTDLHEIAGHGSGKVVDGVNTESLGVYYSVIEEARADLVALYFMSDSNLLTFGIYDDNVNVEEAALAQYVSYITNGFIGQLNRVSLGNDLTQAHFRNRQLISLWVLEHADKDKVRVIEKDGAHYVEVNDIYHAKELFGKLLSEIQRIKSTGDFEAAKSLVSTYGTKVDIAIHKEIIERISKLNLPKIIGFITPILEQSNGSVTVVQPEGFFDQQIALHSKYTL